MRVAREWFKETEKRFIAALGHIHRCQLTPLAMLSLGFIICALRR